MKKTILITGATAGIGKLTAERLVAAGHRVLVHGRSAGKLDALTAALSAQAGTEITGFRADLSDMAQVEALAAAVTAHTPTIDVLLNNAGVFRTPQTRTAAGLDIRFAVNTLAPYLLTRRLLPAIAPGGRILNLSSAAQAPVSPAALAGRQALADFPAYAQSKLAITMWSAHMAAALGSDGPVVVAINPGSMLGTKMVKDAFGVAGKSVGIGADILIRAALSPEFDGATGRYFDNDSGRFGPPHPDARDARKCAAITRAVEEMLDLPPLG